MTRFSSWFLRVSQLETDPFEKAIEAYTKITEKKRARNKCSSLADPHSFRKPHV
jgi:hypothetical protein